VHVHVVDPSAFTPPYDHALCSALAAAGAEVDLYTARFAYGEVAEPDGYARHELFYRAARGARRASLRRAVKLAEHVPDMLRYARASRTADVVHFQWLALPQIDVHLLPSRAAGRPARVLTAHEARPHEPTAGQLSAQRRLYDRFDAVVTHSEHGRARLVGELGVAPERVHVIPHGALSHLAGGAVAPPPFESSLPVVLFAGLLRPYKGLDVLLEAWRGLDGAELWIAGMPRMDTAALRAAAPPGVRFDERFISDAELRGYMRRADLVVLPYRTSDQSGIALTALAFGKPLLVSEVGGLAELVAAGAARGVPPGDAGALRGALSELLADRRALEALADAALTAAARRYGWDAIARQTLELYRSLLGENPAR
jgi:glycosyltransferase involved in cell wall biosynthesis